LSRLGRHSNRTRLSLFLVAIAAAIVVVAVASILPDDGKSPSISPNENALLDVLGWIPATDESLRAYAAWTSSDTAPIALSDAVGDLIVNPRPLALGISTDWQRITGISASDVESWATSPGAGVTVLKGPFEFGDFQVALDEMGYTREDHHGIPVWIAPNPIQTPSVISGDDLRSLNAVAVAADRIVLGLSADAVARALDAAVGDASSIADDQVAHVAASTGSNVGIMVIDMRDLAVSCGVSNGWQVADFQGASGRSVAITYGYDAAGAPRTSVWTQFANNDQATVNLDRMATDWTQGYLNQLGVGESVATFATVTSVSQSGPFIVADLANGRENGWVRSGIRYLIAICEQSATLMPAGTPDTKTPVSVTS
jgi:hypothetical protein